MIGAINELRRTERINLVPWLLYLDISSPGRLGIGQGA